MIEKLFHNLFQNYSKSLPELKYFKENFNVFQYRFIFRLI
jgi:hypothetical protein